MSCYSSRSSKASIYFTASIVLAFIAISTSVVHSKRQNPTSPTNVSSLELSLNASKALRSAGFNIMAMLLQFSPEIFLSSPNATIFALQDRAISDSYIPPRLLKNFIQYHTIPINLPMKDLLNQPQGACFPTLLPGTKSIAVTSVSPRDNVVEINGVPVSYPDVFFDKTLSVHGVLEPFTSLDAEDFRRGWNNAIELPMCDHSYHLVSDGLEAPNLVQWSLILRRLRLNGFVSFAIGLNSVLEGIVEDYKGLESVTIFAPLKWASLASRSVRFHILPKKMSYHELATMPAGTLLVTLAPDLRVEVSGTPRFGQGLFINGTEIVMPNIIYSERFAVHGISKAFELANP